MSNQYCECKKLATWCYMPGFSNGDYPYFCDDCVPRGCECNHRYSNVDAYHPPLENPDLPEGIENVDWIWIDEGKIWTHIDDKGRQYPCSEFMWDPFGYERDINPHAI